LTPRQKDIVQLFGERAIKQIADVLSLSEKTVEFHKHHIMEAFNLKNNAELILFALTHRALSRLRPNSRKRERPLDIRR
jgi:DNA-binding NarL/FixJ family response regulator